MEIADILEKLFGKIYPYGSTEIDDERAENIVNYEIALEFMTQRLIECAKFKDDNRYSVKDIGERTYNILYENKELIEDELDL